MNEFIFPPIVEKRNEILKLLLDWKPEKFWRIDIKGDENPTHILNPSELERFYALRKLHPDQSDNELRQTFYFPKESEVRVHNEKIGFEDFRTIIFSDGKKKIVDEDTYNNLFNKDKPLSEKEIKEILHVT